MMVYDDSVADSKVFDLCSGFVYYSRYLMSKDGRSNVFSMNLLHISPADPTRSHSHEYLVGINLRRREVLNLNRSILLDDYGLHRSTLPNMFKTLGLSLMK